MALVHRRASPEARGCESRKYLIITLLNQLPALISMQNLPGENGGEEVKTHISTDNHTSGNKTTLQNDTGFLLAHTKLLTNHSLLPSAFLLNFTTAL